MITLKLNGEATSLQVGDIIMLDLYGKKGESSNNLSNNIFIKRGEYELINDKKETIAIMEIFDKEMALPQMVRRVRTFGHTISAFKNIGLSNQGTSPLEGGGWRFQLEVTAVD